MSLLFRYARPWSSLEETIGGPTPLTGFAASYATQQSYQVTVHFNIGFGPVRMVITGPIASIGDTQFQRANPADIHINLGGRLCAPDHTAFPKHFLIPDDNELNAALRPRAAIHACLCVKPGRIAT